MERFRVLCGKPERNAAPNPHPDISSPHVTPTGVSSPPSAAAEPAHVAGAVATSASITVRSPPPPPPPPSLPRPPPPPAPSVRRRLHLHRFLRLSEAPLGAVAVSASAALPSSVAAGPPPPSGFFIGPPSPPVFFVALSHCAGALLHLRALKESSSSSCPRPPYPNFSLPVHNKEQRRRPVAAIMRKLKYHEKKLLKKVNFLEWKREGGHREALVMRRYHLIERDDYKKYSSICRTVLKLVNLLKQMDPRDPYRIEMTDTLLEKLYNMGVIPTRKSLTLCERLSVSSFCRRRLATILVRQKFAEHMKEAITYIQQGHVRVGPETVTDPAFLVTRNMEDFITWVDSSKIKRKVLEYNDRLDDYDAMN
ncbi:hypothetical protein Taro_029480 [Colocasia esculenta]|uniref:U3 small nucleolar ribonucleoprotein protein IMP3 n=1 Tax=Colocasia esculenta TaxID=4460 RepID=A0A843VDX5_COLES|nr:hypothetical protein [Colocasia esculenta]